MHRDVFGWKMESAQMEALNAILILVPSFAYGVYPGLQRLGFKVTLLQRMAAGMFIAVPNDQRWSRRNGAPGCTPAQKIGLVVQSPRQGKNIVVTGT